MSATLLFTLLVGLVSMPEANAAQGNVENGQKVYEQRCEQCHGADGAADGAAAPFVYPRPRVFKENSVYKFAVTPDGVIPTDDDLYKVIDVGIPGTSMPGFPILSEAEKWDLVAVLKSWSEDFADPEYIAEAIPMSELSCPPIAASPDSIALGRKVYEENMCSDCHGAAGRGDGPNWASLAEDSWGNILVPRNLSNPESFRNGYGQADIMKTLSRGLTGSPMASYRDAISVNDRWHLVNYIRSLAETPKQVKDERILAVKADKLPTTADDSAWDDAPMARFSLLSQIVEPPRLYWPSVEFVNAQALYNSQGLAMKVTWDDRSNSTGSNTEDNYEDRDGTVYRDTDHPDQMAIQFPAKKDKDGARPYFLLGDKKRAVNTWWWRGDTNALTEINAKGFGSFQPQSDSSQQVNSTVSYADGRYTMIINRPLTTSDRNDVQFEEGGWTPVGFNVWDGSKGEIGQRRSISTWYWLFLEPEIPAQAHVLPPVMFLLALGALGLLVRTTREWAKVESGEQDSPTPLMSEQAPTTDGKYGILIGIFGVLIGAFLMQGVASNDTNPVQTAIGNHQNISLATGSFYESSDIDEVRTVLISSGVPNALASANDLTDAHLTLEGGVRIDGDHVGGAFRYKHDGEIFVLQKYNELPGGGTTEYSRHIGHMLMRGYEGLGASAAVWEQSGTFYVFTGQGSQDHILDVAAKAFFNVDGDNAHH
jgi:complex iron-sulfur molybdoenzyme family reductase subunit gamma